MFFNNTVDSIVSDFTKIVNKLDKLITANQVKKEAEIKVIDALKVEITESNVNISSLTAEINKAYKIKDNINSIISV